MSPAYGSNESMTERLRQELFDFVEQHAPQEEHERAREAASYAVELIRPSLEALERADYLDCVRHLDDVSMEVASLGFGDVVELTAKRASESSRGIERENLVGGWAQRAQGYADLASGAPGKARRRFRRALRYGEMDGNSTLVGASWLSIGVSFWEQKKQREARVAYETSLSYARQADEPWVLAYTAGNLASLLGSEEAVEAERLIEESLRARKASPLDMPLAPTLTNLGILRSQQGRYSEAERLFKEALEHGAGTDPRGVLLPLQNLAKVLSEQRRFPEAAEHYKEAISFAREVNDYFREGQLRTGLAVCLASAEDYAGAHGQFEMLLGMAERFGLSGTDTALILRDLGVTAMRLEQTEEGVAYFREARQRYEVLGDKRGIAMTLLDEAMAQNSEDTDTQILLIRQALDSLKGTRHHDLKLDAYRKLIWELFEQLQVDEAAEAFDKERRLLLRLGRTRTLARRLTEFGSLLASARLHRDASRKLSKAAALYEELGDETELMRARNDMANSMVQLGNIQEAEEIYFGNLDSARRLNNRALQLDAWLNLGELSRRNQRTDLAVCRLQKAITLSRSLHDLSALALGLNNLGLAWEATGEIDRARGAFEQSLEAAFQAHSDEAIARATSSLGTTAFDRGDYEEARDLYEQAVERAGEAGDRGLEAKMLLNLAAAVHKKLGPEEAEPSAERAVEIAQEILHYDTAFDVSSSMTNWFLESRDWEKAGEWSAYALLFGPLIGDDTDHWLVWIMSALSNVDQAQDQDHFLTVMERACRRLEEENGLTGHLIPIVEAISSRFTQP